MVALPPMKALAFLTLALGLGLTPHAHAFRGAELEERMALMSEVESADEKAAMTTSIVFKLINPQGERSVLQTRNGDLLVKPASTMKLFTGWMALMRGTQTDEYLGEMLRMSDNAKAEETLRAMGGTRALTTFLTEEGLNVNARTFQAVDGSGLSKANRASCNFEISLLEHIHASSEYERYRALLAQPGVAGTLEKRLLPWAGKLFAKTGTLRLTIALTGFAETSKGTVLFCVIAENFSNTWDQQRARIDSLVSAKLLELERAP